MKQCNKCGEAKILGEFGRCSDCYDGFTSTCKSCKAKKDIARQRTKKGLVKKIHLAQISNSKKRGHTPPAYTLYGLRMFFKSSAVADHLYKAWVASGYEKNLRPSVDRKEDDKPYSIDNITLMTWGENKAKGHSDRRNGINNKVSKAVIQLTLEGEFIAEFYSMSEAGRQTGISIASIGQCCNNIQSYNTAGNFKWKFKSTTAKDK